MTREQISEIIGGVDIGFVEEAKTVRRLYSPKKLITIGLVATLSLSLVAWTGHSIVKKLALGSIYTETYDPSTGSTSGSLSMYSDEKVFEEINNEVYFVFNGNEKNITEYCTATTFFAYEEIDEKGNGFVLVVGGSEGNRGYFCYNYEDGRMFAGTGEFNGDGDIEKGQNEATWVINADKVYSNNSNF